MPTPINLSETTNLQAAVESHWADGKRAFELTGTYIPPGDTHAVLRINQRLSGIALSGTGVLDARGRASHVLIIEDAEADIKDLEIVRGNTANLRRVAKNYDSERLRSVHEATDGAGALVLGQSSVQFTNISFLHNYSGMRGGGLSNQGTGLVTIEECTFRGNSTHHAGGAIDNLTPGARLSVYKTKFHYNTSDNKGHIAVCEGTSATIAKCEFMGVMYPQVYAAPGAKVELEGNYISSGYPFYGTDLIDSDFVASEPSAKERLLHGLRTLTASAPLLRIGLYPWARR